MVEVASTWAERYWSLPVFYVWPHPAEDRGEFVHAETAGKAKAAMWRRLRESRPDLRYASLRARAIRPEASTGESGDG